MAKIILRKAVNADFTRITKLLNEAPDPPRIRVGRVNENDAYQFILNTIQRGFAYVADLDGNIVGTMGCAALPVPMSRDTVLISDWLYVQPKYRQDGLAESLIRAASRFARKVNAELRLHICERDYQDFGAAAKAYGMRDAGRVLILGRDEGGNITEEPALPGSPGPADVRPGPAPAGEAEARAGDGGSEEVAGDSAPEPAGEPSRPKVSTPKRVVPAAAKPTAGRKRSKPANRSAGDVSTEAGDVPGRTRAVKLVRGQPETVDDPNGLLD